MSEDHQSSNFLFIVQSARPELSIKESEQPDAASVALFYLQCDLCYLSSHHVHAYVSTCYSLTGKC